jgi:hypothetical protein
MSKQKFLISYKEIEYPNLEACYNKRDHYMLEYEIVETTFFFFRKKVKITTESKTFLMDLYSGNFCASDYTKHWDNLIKNRISL